MPAPARSAPAILTNITDALTRAERWLDARGPWAWAGAIVLGFLVTWQLGLALLIWRAVARDLVRGAAPQDARPPVSHPVSPRNRSETPDADEQARFEAFANRLRRREANLTETDDFDAFLDARARAHGPHADAD